MIGISGNHKIELAGEDEAMKMRLGADDESLGDSEGSSRILKVRLGVASDGEGATWGSREWYLGENERCSVARTARRSHTPDSPQCYAAPV